MPQFNQGRVMRNSKILLILSFVLVSHTSFCAKLANSYIEVPEEHIEIPYYALDGCQIFYYCKHKFIADFKSMGVPTTYMQLYAYAITKIPERDFIMYFFLVESERYFCVYYVKCHLNDGKVCITPWDYNIAKRVFPAVFTKEKYVNLAK